MAINFPNAPVLNQELIVGETTWTWTGYTWDIKSATPPTVSQNTFQTISVVGQFNVVAEIPNDTLTFAAGPGITITTNNATDTITFASTGGGGGGTATDLDSLTDVAITSPINGQVLKYNGTNWTNNTDLTGTASLTTVDTSLNRKTLRMSSNGIQYDVGLEAGSNINLSLANNIITVNSSLSNLALTPSLVTGGKVKLSLTESSLTKAEVTFRPGNNISLQIVNNEIQISASQNNTGIFTVPLRVNNNTVSTSSITGALTVTGGTGIAGDLYLGGDLNIEGEAYSATAVIADSQLTNKKYVDSQSVAFSIVFGL
jgi:hypothetical protein